MPASARSVALMLRATPTSADLTASFVPAYDIFCLIFAVSGIKLSKMTLSGVAARRWSCSQSRSRRTPAYPSDTGEKQVIPRAESTLSTPARRAFFSIFMAQEPERGALQLEVVERGDQVMGDPALGEAHAVYEGRAARMAVSEQLIRGARSLSHPLRKASRSGAVEEACADLEAGAVQLE